jgi:hypothetical protein
VSDENAAPERPATKARDSSRPMYIIIIGIAIIVWAAVAAFFFYTIGIIYRHEPILGESIHH